MFPKVYFFKKNVLGIPKEHDFKFKTSFCIAREYKNYYVHYYVEPFCIYVTVYFDSGSFYYESLIILINETKKLD